MSYRIGNRGLEPANESSTGSVESLPLSPLYFPVMSDQLSTLPTQFTLNAAPGGTTPERWTFPPSPPHTATTGASLSILPTHFTLNAAPGRTTPYHAQHPPATPRLNPNELSVMNSYAHHESVLPQEGGGGGGGGWRGGVDHHVAVPNTQAPPSTPQSDVPKNWPMGVPHPPLCKNSVDKNGRHKGPEGQASCDGEREKRPARLARQVDVTKTFFYPYCIKHRKVVAEQQAAGNKRKREGNRDKSAASESHASMGETVTESNTRTATQTVMEETTTGSVSRTVTNTETYTRTVRVSGMDPSLRGSGWAAHKGGLTHYTAELGIVRVHRERMTKRKSEDLVYCVVCSHRNGS
jgi:hypothetical protein